LTKALEAETDVPKGLARYQAERKADRAEAP